MYRDGWSSPHVNTGLQFVTRISIEICFNEFNTKNSKRSLMISGIIMSSNATLEGDRTLFYNSVLSDVRRVSYIYSI